MNLQQCRQLFQELATGSPFEKEKAKKRLRHLPLNGYTKTVLLCEAPYFNDVEIMETVLQKLTNSSLTDRELKRLDRALEHWARKDPRAFTRFSPHLEKIRSKAVLSDSQPFERRK